MEAWPGLVNLLVAPVHRQTVCEIRLVVADRIRKIIRKQLFELREVQQWKAVAMRTEKNLWRRSTAFEPLFNCRIRLIQRQRPAAGKDDELVRKKSRGDRMAIELFLSGVATWEPQVRRLIWFADTGEL